MHTTEFWTITLMFQNVNEIIKKGDLLEIILEGPWKLLQKFAYQQRQVYDQSTARRQKFLMDYALNGSKHAALCLLKTDWEFAIKKLNDSQVLTILESISYEEPLGEQLAKEILQSPRGQNVRKKSSEWLFSKAGEKIPQDWNYESVLRRFLPNYNQNVFYKPTSKPTLAPIKNPVPQNSSSLNSKENFVIKKSTQTSPSTSLIYSPKKNSTVSTTTTSYVVQEGDSLWKIAKKFNTSVDKIKTINQLPSDKIKPGKVLSIPNK